MNKMKITMISLAFLGFALGGMSTAAAEGYGTAGCGLGSVLIESGGFMQVFAATTNGSSYSQTFGITSGTSNCVEKGVVKIDKEQEVFVETNLDALQADMAAGGGEYLNGLATLMGCEESVWADVGSLAQANYSSVFPRDSTPALHALYTLKSEMSLNEDLAGACTQL